MGVLPLAFPAGETAASLGLTGQETFAITGIASGLTPGGTVTVTATKPESGKTISFAATVRLNSEIELEYLAHGGILQRVLRVFNE
jgi:aconitate hydratase